MSCFRWLQQQHNTAVMPPVTVAIPQQQAAPMKTEKSTQKSTLMTMAAMIPAANPPASLLF